jgi:hypothetical protein
MKAITFIVMWITLGWIGGRVLGRLYKANARGFFTNWDWVIWISTLLGIFVFARYSGQVIRLYRAEIPEWAIYTSAVLMLFIAFFVSGIGRK